MGATLPPARYERDAVPAGCPLSRAEFEVIGLLAEGLTYKQIALRLGKGHSTVRSHLHNAYGRLGVFDRAQAILRCEQEGWLSSNPARRSRCEALLEEIKPILEACLRQLEQGTRHRVTRSQYAYLKAFDRFLRSPGHEADGAMGRALTAVLEDAEIIQSADSRGQRHRRRPVPEAA